MPKGPIVAVLLGALLLTSGCAVQVGFQTLQQREAALAVFRTGQARLDCPTAGCLAVWNATRPVVQQAAFYGDWETVAADVMAAGYDQDLGWYYLGAAAAGMGNRAAARTYYERSIERSMRGGLQACAPVDCDGRSLPAESRIALDTLRTAPARVVRRRAPARQVAPASASGNWVSPTGAGATSAAHGAGGSGWVAPVQSSPE